MYFNKKLLTCSFRMECDKDIKKVNKFSVKMRIYNYKKTNLKGQQVIITLSKLIGLIVK